MQRTRTCRVRVYTHRETKAKIPAKAILWEQDSMTTRTPWPHVLVIVGLIAMLIGAIDPLEGSLIILPGSGLVALGALLGQCRHRRLLYWAFG